MSNHHSVTPGIKPTAHVITNIYNNKCSIYKKMSHYTYECISLIVSQIDSNYQ